MATIITCRDTRKLDSPNTPDGPDELWHRIEPDDPARSLCGLRLDEGPGIVLPPGHPDSCIVCDDLADIGRDRGDDRDDAFDEEKAEREAERRRLLGEGINPDTLYKAHPLTPAEIEAATREMLAIVAFPGMREGWVAFDDGLENGRWHDDPHGGEGYAIMVEVPASPDFESCRSAVLAALAEECARWRAEAEEHSAAALEVA